MRRVGSGLGPPETRVAGVAYRTLAGGDRLAIHFVAAWREDDEGEATQRLAAAAHRVLGSELGT